MFVSIHGMSFCFSHTVRSHVGWGGEQNIFFIRAWKPLPNKKKNLEGKPGSKNTKRTISPSGWLGALQMISEPNTGRCTNEEAELEGGWTRGSVPGRTLSPEGVN